jgi:hypothetical protein
MGHLDIRLAYFLEDSSVLLLPNIPDNVQKPSVAGTLSLLVGPDQHSVPPVIHGWVDSLGEGLRADI